MQTRNGSEFPPYEKIYSKPTVNIIHTNESKFSPQSLPRDKGKYVGLPHWSPVGLIMHKEEIRDSSTGQEEIKLTCSRLK